MAGLKDFFSNSWTTTIVGTMIGVLVAFLLNNWWNNQQEQKLINRVLDNLISEITQNKDLLSPNLEQSKVSIAPLSDLILTYYVDEKIRMSPQQMAVYQSKHPQWFRLSDSIKINKNLFEYKGDFEVPSTAFLSISLKESAWRSAVSMGILQNMDFNCVAHFESIYAIQSQVKKQHEATIQSIQIGLEEYVKNFLTLIKFEEVLMGAYDSLEQGVENCR